jgi:HpaII restriction endonuclease
MLTGNKGEWSEIYVFLKLLADGKIDSADADLQVIPQVYYPIIKILRSENDQKREYVIDKNINLIDGKNNQVLLTIPLSDFAEKSKELFNALKAAKGSSFSFSPIEDFLESINVKKLTANRGEKADISIVVHDLRTGMQPELGFSIKSMMGKNATLFNPGNTTNFIYEIIGNPSLLPKVVNDIETPPKIANRIQYLKTHNYIIQFCDIASKNLKLNLQLIDSDLPRIIAELLLIKYANSGTTTIYNALQQLNGSNPLNYDFKFGHPFYEYKIKNFLTDVALGMTPTSIWKGTYDATGGILIVKEDGAIVCYHIYNRNEFQEYLLKNTRIEQASTSRYEFGEVYSENGKFYLKLNLQIRFT